MLSSDLFGHQAHTVHLHTCRQNTHIFKKDLVLFLSMCICLCKWMPCVGTFRSQREHWVPPLELELKVSVCHLTWVLGYM